MPFRPSQPPAIAIRETYETFNARHKAADARAAVESDLKALEASIERLAKGSSPDSIFLTTTHEIFLDKG